MTWIGGNGESSVIGKKIFEAVNTVIICVDLVLSKRIYINIIVILLSGWRVRIFSLLLINKALLQISSI